MSHLSGFLQAILDDPEDDSARLIFADWLEEQLAAAVAAPALAEVVNLDLGGRLRRFRVALDIESTPCKSVPRAGTVAAVAGPISLMPLAFLCFPHPNSSLAHGPSFGRPALAGPPCGVVRADRLVKEPGLPHTGIIL
jgi:uncharacterized protein (TIGR02996 family)